jgi:hypothetical protein
MTRHVVRAYAAAGTLLVLFLAWAVISANPWATQTATVDPRIAALQTREAALRHEAVVVRRVVRHRWAVYKVRLAHRNRQIALVQKSHQRAVASAQVAAARSYSAPSASVVSLPALTVTRSS